LKKELNCNILILYSLRYELWDPNNNNYLSLAEVDLGIKKLLRCEKVFKSKPAILRAF
jgi:hypothetical protein